MIRIRLVMLFFLVFLTLKSFSGQVEKEHYFPAQKAGANDVTISSKDIFFYNSGEIPSANISFNTIGSTSNVFTNKLRIRALNTQQFHSISKVNLNYFIPQGYVFSRYSSSFQQIYLKTACFRL